MAWMRLEAPLRPSPPRSVAVAALTALAVTGCTADVELEVISRVPAHVLTAAEVRDRMRRLGAELGVGTDGLLVQGACVTACEQQTADGCVVRFGEPGERPIPVLMAEPTELRAGHRYVLRGSVRADVRVKERWIFIGAPLAEVRTP